MAISTTIKKIRTSDGDHLIEAASLTYVSKNTSVSKTYEDIHDEINAVRSIAQGAIETYVIPSKNSGISGYNNIVRNAENTIKTTETILSNLITTANHDTNGSFKVGDVILMEEVADPTNTEASKHQIFDRWISAIDGKNITLTVLETQVATHHHTINIGSSSSKALTSVTASTQTAALTIVGDAVTVLTSVSSNFISSVDYEDDGEYDLEIETVQSSEDGGRGHSHSTVAHSHSFTPISLVSQTVSAITSLDSTSRTFHSHTVVSAAGTPNNGSKFDIVTGVSETGTFLINLDDSNLTTGSNTKGLATGNSGDDLSTPAQTTKDSIGSIVYTVAGGSHTHDVTVTTTENVVKTATVAPSVVTSVSYSFTQPSVAPSVVTSVTKVAKTVVTSATLSGITSFVASVSVDTSGVLSFGSGTVGISAPTSTISAVNEISTTSQTSGSLSISAPRTSQSMTSGTVTITGKTGSSGSHSHGFSHTHKIPVHNHSIESHTHSYVKTVASQSGLAITSLSYKNFIPHTHSNNVGAAAIAANESSAVTIITGGSKTEVVQTLKSSIFSTGNASPGTTDTYLKITGTITHPGLTTTPGTITTSSKSITPAVSGTETALKSIEFASSDFITSVTSGSGIKTSENKGGK